MFNPTRLREGDMVQLHSGGRPFTVSFSEKEKLTLVSMSDGGLVSVVEVHPHAVKKYTGSIPYVTPGKYTR